MKKEKCMTENYPSDIIEITLPEEGNGYVSTRDGKKYEVDRKTAKEMLKTITGYEA